MGLFVHGTCVAVDNIGCLLLGPSGCGKSDLALRLVLDQDAKLVADDQVVVERRLDRLVATPPAELAGLIEVRGLGILRMANRSRARLGLAVVLVSPDEVERLPEANEGIEYFGLALPLLRLAPFEVSASHKVRLAARQWKLSIMRRP